MRGCGGDFDLTIAIVSFNARDHLDRCLASLHSPPPAPAHEIVVVDNASSDGSPEQVERRWPSVRLVRNRDNVGFARASNQAMHASRSRLVLLLNSDTVVPEGAIETLIAALDAEPHTGAAGPRLVNDLGRAELSFGRMVGPLSELRQKVLGRLYDRDVPGVAQYVERATRRAHHPDWVSGACLLVRREAAEQAGLLDERYFMYLEDVDFCAALRARGWRILFTPAVEVVHLRGRSVAAAPASTARRYRESQLAFYAKHHPRLYRLLRAYLTVTRKY